MKLTEIPGLMDWIKTLPQQWVDDPEGWEMENFYFVRSDGVIAGQAGTLRLALREGCNGNKDRVAAAVKIVAKKGGAAALVHATEGWVMSFKNSNLNSTPPSNDEIMEAYGPSPEAEKVRQRLGIERVHALTIMAQTNEEAYMVSYRAYENPKVIGDVLQEGIVLPMKDTDGTFTHLLE